MSRPRLLFRGVVYPSLCDGMGHLSTRHYMSFFDDAAYHFFFEIGSSLAEDASCRLGWADVKHVIDYSAETRKDDLVAIESVPLKLGRSSVVYRQTLKKIDNGLVLATQEATAVRFDLENRRALPIEDRLRVKVEAWIAEE